MKKVFPFFLAAFLLLSCGPQSTEVDMLAVGKPVVPPGQEKKTPTVQVETPVPTVPVPTATSIPPTVAPAATTVPTATAQPATPVPTSTPVPTTQLCGMNVSVMDTRGDLVREFNLVKQTGCNTVRFGLSWATLEPSRGSYTPWFVSRLDYVATTAESMGIKLIPALFQSPAWANAAATSGNYAPSNMADYGSAFGWLYNRYGNRFLAYEVWNEPTLSTFWGFTPNASRYVDMLRAARSAAPNAYILGGSLSSTVTDYLQQMYTAGAKGTFNALSLHPYVWMDPAPGGSPTDCGYMPMSYACGVPAIHDVMVRNGDTSDIWFTELGWTTAQGYTTEQTQADYLRQAYQLYKTWPYVHYWSWYVLTDLMYLDPTYPTSDKECCFGLYRTDLSPKPAVSVLTSLPK